MDWLPAQLLSSCLALACPELVKVLKPTIMNCCETKCATFLLCPPIAVSLWSPSTASRSYNLCISPPAITLESKSEEMRYSVTFRKKHARYPYCLYFDHCLSLCFRLPNMENTYSSRESDQKAVTRVHVRYILHSLY